MDNKHNGRITGILACICLVLALPLMPRLASALEKSDDEGGSLAESIHGYMSARYIYRDTREDIDQDMDGGIGLEIGDPSRHQATGHFMARGRMDVDGKSGHDGYYPFDNVNDAYGDNLDGWIYYAHVDLHRIENIKVVSIGRQLLWDTPVFVHFDGVRVETEGIQKLSGLKFGAYGGVPAHLYESSPEGDAVYGAFARARPLPGTNLSLHWMHIEDDNLFGDESDDLYELKVSQAINESLRVESSYTRLEEKSRDLELRTTYFNADRDLLVQGSYYELLETQKVHSIELDHYYGAANEYHPYRQFSVLVYKGLGEAVAVTGGLDGRGLVNEDDEGPLNHEFLHYFASASINSKSDEGPGASVTVDSWESYTLDEDIVSLGGDVSYEFGEKFRANTGVYYSLYKYDYYLDSERFRVRTYYVKLRYRPTEALTFNLGYEFEDNDFDDYQRLQIGTRTTF